MSEEITKKIRHAAITYLARREHSQHELQRKLQTKGYQLDNIIPVLSQLIEDNYLNETRFSEVLIRSRINKGQGPLRIRQVLQEHGIDPDIFADIFYPDDEMWDNLAQMVREKRFGKAKPTDLASKAKQTRFLYGRGFSHNQIRLALSA
jgi:regulatory protein